MLPKSIPKDIRAMIVTARPFDESKDDAHDLLLREAAKEAMLQKEFAGDKGRAVKQNAEQIQRVKELQKHPTNSQHSKRLENWLDGLYVVRFGLLRDEYLSLIKRKTGDITAKSLAQIQGSPEWLKEKNLKRDKKNKNQN